MEKKDRIKQMKRSLLMTYMTSLLCLVLCVTMFLGTTFAWFTSEVVNTSNEIYVGTLEAELYHKVEKDNGDTEFFLLNDDTTGHKIFSSDARWEPNYTAVETLKVANGGDLTFAYQLELILDVENTDLDPEEIGNQYNEEALKTLAKWFTVYVREGEPDEDDTSFENIAADNDWKRIGDDNTTLADILYGDVLIYSSELAAVEKNSSTADVPTEIFTIALHLDKDAPIDIMGQKLSLNVKLVAYQMDYEEDGFGNEDFDQDAVPMQTITVTPENIGTITYDQDNIIYKFIGTFENLTITTTNGLTQKFDGSEAIINGTIAVNAPGIADGYSALQAERSGSITISGFTRADEQTDLALNICAYNNEELNIIGNSVNAIDIVGGNFALNINGNYVAGGFETHTNAQNGTNEYGISMRICDYELTFDNNTVENAYSHAIGINGRQGEESIDWRDCGQNNKIVSFRANTIRVNSEQKTERAALKIWCDKVYAPYATSGQKPNTAAQELMAGILADASNKFELLAEEGHTIFNIFDYKTDNGTTPVTTTTTQSE